VDRLVRGVLKEGAWLAGLGGGMRGKGVERSRGGCMDGSVGTYLTNITNKRTKERKDSMNGFD